MMLMTENNVNDYINIVKIFTTQKLGTNLNVLEITYPQVSKALNYFIKSYDEWYKFHANHHNNAGCLSLKETQELISLMDNRDSSRNTLIELIKLEENEVQLEAQVSKEKEMDCNFLKEKSQENKKVRLKK